MGSRKLYAVPSSDIELHRGNSDDLPTPKRKRSSLILETNSDAVDAVENLVDEVSSMKEEIHKFHKLAFKYRFSLSFLNSLEEAFACSICRRTPCKLPIIACQSCNTIVGCQKCTNRWYSGAGGLEKPCPKCRTPRGLSKTFLLKGFDELVKQTLEMMKPDSGTSSSEGNESESDLPIALDN